MSLVTLLSGFSPIILVVFLITGFDYLFVTCMCLGTQILRVFSFSGFIISAFLFFVVVSFVKLQNLRQSCGYTYQLCG